MPIHHAILVTVGDELLCGQVLNTNAAWLGAALAPAGWPVGEQLTVGDDPAAMREAIVAAAGRARLVVVSGGLGPTPDDHTRSVLAELAGVPLQESPALRARLAALAARRGRPPGPPAARQAWLPAGVETLANPVGLAPGLWLPLGAAVVCALPGVPAELRAVTEGALLPRLARLPGRAAVASRTLRTVGVPESELVGLLEGEDGRSRRDAALAAVSIAYLPGRAAVDLRFDARGEGAAARVEAAVARARARIGERLGPVVYGEGRAELAAVVLELARRRGQRLAVAESCTGGLVAKRLTDVPGSSQVFAGGVVAYSNAAKVELLGVPRDLIEQHGAVSEAVAGALAAGARARFATGLGLAATGVAGPGGGSPEKPVGLVWVAVDGPGEARRVRRLRLGAGREQVRERAATLGLALLRRSLLGERGGGGAEDGERGGGR